MGKVSAFPDDKMLGVSTEIGEAGREGCLADSRSIKSCGIWLSFGVGCFAGFCSVEPCAEAVKDVVFSDGPAPWDASKEALKLGETWLAMTKIMDVNR